MVERAPLQGRPTTESKGTMRELPQISESRRPRCALGILLLHFQMSLVLYTSLLHALDDSDVPHEVSEQYVLCYSRFSTLNLQNLMTLLLRPLVR